MEPEMKIKTTAIIVAEFEKTMQCNCDLDNWQPEKVTGHSWVCRIHKATMRTLREQHTKVFNE